MSAARRRRWRVQRDEAGLTVVELTVVLLILSIVSMMMFSFLDHMTNISARATLDVQNEAQANIILRTVTEDLRAASSIRTTYPSTTSCPAGGTYPGGYASCISFNVPHITAVNTRCPYTAIIYGIVGSTLYEDQTVYDASCTATSTTTHKVLASNVSNGSTPMLTYYDATGNQLSATSSGAGLTFTTNPSDWIVASTVKISLAFTYRAGAPAVPFTSSAALRNNR